MCTPLPGAPTICSHATMTFRSEASDGTDGSRRVPSEADRALFFDQSRVSAPREPANMSQPTSGEPAKKRQKTLLACADCRRSKTRCEPTTAGCHRCTVLHKSCSLSGSDALAAFHSSNGPPPSLHGYDSSLPPPTGTASPATTSTPGYSDAVKEVVSEQLTCKVFPNPWESDLDMLSTLAADEAEQSASDTMKMLILRPFTMGVALLSRDPQAYPKPSGWEAGASVPCPS